MQISLISMQITLHEKSNFHPKSKDIIKIIAGTILHHYFSKVHNKFHKIIGAQK